MNQLSWQIFMHFSNDYIGLVKMERWSPRKYLMTIIGWKIKCIVLKCYIFNGLCKRYQCYTSKNFRPFYLNLESPFPFAMCRREWGKKLIWFPLNWVRAGQSPTALPRQQNRRRRQINWIIYWWRVTARVSVFFRTVKYKGIKWMPNIACKISQW